jgi:hypothetical protein
MGERDTVGIEEGRGKSRDPIEPEKQPMYQ